MRGFRILGYAVMPLSFAMELRNAVATLPDTIETLSAQAMAAGVRASCDPIDRVLYDPELNNEMKVMLLQKITEDLQGHADLMNKTGKIQEVSPEASARQEEAVRELAETFVRMKEVDEQ